MQVEEALGKNSSELGLTASMKTEQKCRLRCAVGASFGDREAHPQRVMGWRARSYR